MTKKILKSNNVGRPVGRSKVQRSIPVSTFLDNFVRSCSKEMKNEITAEMSEACTDIIMKYYVLKHQIN